MSEGKFGTTVLTLSNGAKVIVKPTDFKQDEIVMTAFKEGGKRAYDAKDAANVMLAGDAAEVSRLGSFDQVKLGKYLAGKNVSLGYNIGNTVNALDGKSTVKDLPTFMEVLYATFTELNPDETAYNAYIDQIRTILKNNDKNPTSVFQRAVAKATYAGNPMFQQPSVELLEAGNYARELEIVKSSLKNAADFTFIFTGNIDLDTFKPLVEQYIAALPSTGKKGATPAKLTSINIAEGVVNDTFKQPMQVPSTMVLTNISGKNVDYSIANFVKIDLIGDILSNVFTETLREEEGGTYSPYAYGTFNPFTGTWQIVYVFQTNDQMQDKLITRANEELLKLLSNGAGEADFNKVKEAALKQYEINVRTNGYWRNNLQRLELGYDDISGHKAAIENLTLADFNKFMSSLYDGKNHIQVVMQGVAESE